jgi:iron complex transport system substrate-binding protein
MKKWLVLLLVVICWLLAGFALFGEAGTTSGSTRPVNRIVSMAPSLTEILFALGLGEKVVAVSANSDYPAKAAQLPKIGTFWQPNIEAVIAARPDLVVMLGFDRQRDFGHRLEKIGYDTLPVDIEKVDQLFDRIEEIGTATQTNTQAQYLVADIKERLTSISTKVESLDKIKVLYVVQREPLRVAGRDNFVNEMIELAGGENAIGPTVHKYPPIGAEQLLACRAQVIIEPVMGSADLVSAKEAAMKFWSRYPEVPAVKENRIYVIDGDTVSRLGPRLCEAIEKLAVCLRPGLFAE